MSEPSDHDPLVHDLRNAPASMDVADGVARGVRAGVGVVALGLGAALRALGESPSTLSLQPGPAPPAADVTDLLVGTAWGAARLSGRLATTGVRITAPLLNLALRPPLVPRRMQPGYGLQVLVDRWQRDLHETLGTLGRWSATALPGAVDTALDQVDVERVVTVVLDRVNLDILVADIVRRLDLDALTTAVVERLDLDSLVQTSLDNLDLDPIVRAVIARTDVDAIAAAALAQMHLAPVVSSALDQLDLTQLVLDRVDLERVVTGALERLDLTAIVVDQVDLGSVVAAAVQRVDLTQMVLQQVDLIGVAEYVVEGIDLPEIIRDSTGSVASEAVRGLRMQGVDADIALGRVVDRMLHRRRLRRTEKAPEQLTASNSPEGPPAGEP